MSLENILYDFAVSVAADEANAANYGAFVHADTYEELKGASGLAKWIRVDDLIQSVPEPPLTGVRYGESKAIIDIQFVVRPETQSLEHRREARAKASAMAVEFSGLIRTNSRLGDNSGEICDCLVSSKRNEWRKAGNVRHAVSFLRLTLNP